MTLFDEIMLGPLLVVSNSGLAIKIPAVTCLFVCAKQSGFGAFI